MHDSLSHFYSACSLYRLLGTYMLWTSWIMVEAGNVDRRINPSTTYFMSIYLVLAGHRINIFSSMWVEQLDICRASIKQVLALVLRAPLKGTSEKRGHTMDLGVV
jgi:hypothetical protein